MSTILSTLTELTSPGWPEEPECDASASGWIERGQVYAEGIELCRAQLRTAIAIEGIGNTRLFGPAENPERPPAWQERVIRYLLSELEGADHFRHADAAVELAMQDVHTDAQRLGVALELAGVGFLRLSLHVIKNLIETRQPGQGECLYICALFIACLPLETGTSEWVPSKYYKEWEHDVGLCLEAIRTMISAIRVGQGAHDQSALVSRLETLVEEASDKGTNASSRWDNMRFRVSEALSKGERKASRGIVLEWISSSWGNIPQGVETQTYVELLLNACSIGDVRQPQRWLIESRSLPRSGHHFLKSLLKCVWGKDFSYCEGYQESGCCKTSPCSVSAYWHFAEEHKRPHLRLLKSHDFSLTDSDFEPPQGMVRLIQVRQPFDLLISWIELQQIALNRQILNEANIAIGRIYLYHEPELLEEAWRLIDEDGTVMSVDQAQEWLSDKVSYIVGFLRKWLPRVRSYAFDQSLRGGNFLLRYEDLDRCHLLLKALGRVDIDVDRLPAFSPRQRQVLKRRSQRVTELVETCCELILQADTVVMTEVPAMRLLYPEDLNMFRGQSS